MQTLEKIYEHALAVEPFQVDCTGHIFPGVLGNHMLGAAGIHADRRGFGISRLNNEAGDGYTWVLSRLVLRMERDWPVADDKIAISTWIDGVQRLFTSRCFDIKGEDGSVYGYARSIWAMINLRTRRPEDLTSIGQDDLQQYVDTERPCVCPRGVKFRVTATEPTLTRKMSYCDVDINQHVNSMKYVDHIMDVFPLDFHRTHRVTQLELAFVSESHFGDTLQMFVDTVEADKSYNIEVRHENGEAVCRAHLEVAKRE